jgi:hypothetical protein
LKQLFPDGWTQRPVQTEAPRDNYGIMFQTSVATAVKNKAPNIRLQIGRCQAGMFCDSAEDTWAELLIVMKGEDEVGPIGARKCAM